MSKSIKFKNNVYLDSSSVVHNKKSIKDMINSINGNTDGGLAVKRAFRGVSLNNLVSYGNGLFVGMDGCTDTPTYSGQKTYHWYIIQLVYNSGYCVQIAAAVHSDDSTLYKRHLQDNKWYSWKKITFVNI